MFDGFDVTSVGEIIKYLCICEQDELGVDVKDDSKNRNKFQAFRIRRKHGIYLCEISR
jgi:hypothetical protein